MSLNKAMAVAKLVKDSGSSFHEYLDDSENLKYILMILLDSADGYESGLEDIVDEDAVAKIEEEVAKPSEITVELDSLKHAGNYMIKHGLEVTEKDFHLWDMEITGYDTRRKSWFTGRSDGYNFQTLHRWQAGQSKSYYYVYWQEGTVSFRWRNRWSSTLENVKIKFIKR